MNAKKLSVMKKLSFSEFTNVFFPLTDKKEEQFTDQITKSMNNFDQINHPFVDFLESNNIVKSGFLTQNELKKLKRINTQYQISKLKKKIKNRLEKFKQAKEQFLTTLFEAKTDKFEVFQKINHQLFSYYILKRHLEDEHSHDFNEDHHFFVKQKYDVLEAEMNTFLKPLKCKICMEFVPIWIFLEHSNNCCNLYSNNKQVLKVNQTIMSICSEISTMAGTINYFEMIARQKNRFSESGNNPFFEAKHSKFASEANSQEITRRRNSDRGSLSSIQSIDGIQNTRKSVFQKSVFSQYQQKKSDISIDQKKDRKDNNSQESLQFNKVVHLTTKNTSFVQNQSFDQKSEEKVKKNKKSATKKKTNKNSDINEKNQPENLPVKKIDIGTQVELNNKSQYTQTTEMESTNFGQIPSELKNNDKNNLQITLWTECKPISTEGFSQNNSINFNDSKINQKKMIDFGKENDFSESDKLRNCNSVSIGEKSPRKNKQIEKRVSFQQQNECQFSEEISNIKNSFCLHSVRDFEPPKSPKNEELINQQNSEKISDKNKKNIHKVEKNEQNDKIEIKKISHFSNLRQNAHEIKKLRSKSIEKTSKIESSRSLTCPLFLKLIENCNRPKIEIENKEKTGWYKEMKKVVKQCPNDSQFSQIGTYARFQSFFDEEKEKTNNFRNQKKNEKENFELSVDRSFLNEPIDHYLKPTSINAKNDNFRPRFETFGLEESSKSAFSNTQKQNDFEEINKHSNLEKVFNFSQFKTENMLNVKSDDSSQKSEKTKQIEKIIQKEKKQKSKSKNNERTNEVHIETPFKEFPEINFYDKTNNNTNLISPNRHLNFDKEVINSQESQKSRNLSQSKPCFKNSESINPQLNFQLSLDGFGSDITKELFHKSGKSFEIHKPTKSSSKNSIFGVKNSEMLNQTKLQESSDSRSEFKYRQSTISVISSEIMQNINIQKDQKVIDDCMSVHEQVYDNNRNTEHLEERRKTRRSILNSMKEIAKSQSKKSLQKIANDNYDEYNFYMFNKQVKKYRENLLANPFFENFFNDQNLLNTVQNFTGKFIAHKYQEVLNRLNDALIKRVQILIKNKKIVSQIEKINKFSGSKKILREVFSRSCGEIGFKENNKNFDTIKENKLLVQQDTFNSDCKKNSINPINSKLFVDKNILTNKNENPFKQPMENSSVSSKSSNLQTFKNSTFKLSFFDINKNETNQSKFVLPENFDNKLVLEKVESRCSKEFARKCVSDSEFIQTCQREMLYNEKTKEIGIDDFTFLKQIGKGGYGKVYLVCRKNTSDIYAMKIIQFSNDVCLSMLKSLQNEISIMSVLDGEFLVQAYFSFIENQSLCIVMEYLVGGDFRSLLENEGRFDNKTAQWYIAELVLAISQLHSKEIIHRDLKPENLLLNQNGRLKLADFGLSEFRQKIDTNCMRIKKSSQFEIAIKPADSTDKKLIIGTPAYIPPEIISGYIQTDKNELDLNKNDIINTSLEKINLNNDNNDQENVHKHASFEDELNHNPENAQKIDKTERIFDSTRCLRERRKNFYKEQKTLCKIDQISSAIDWWAVGCLLYEFLVGVSAFGDTTIQKVYDNVLKNQLEWPDIGYGSDEITPEAKDLILRFLDPNPRTRLGTYGAKEIMDHPFFKGLDWSRLSIDKPPIVITEKSPLGNSIIKMSKVIDKQDNAIDKLRFISDDFAINRVDLLYDMNIKSFLHQRFY